MNRMTDNPIDDEGDEMLPEYDLTGKTGVRGKYYEQLRAGYTVEIHHEDGRVEVQQVAASEDGKFLAVATNCSQFCEQVDNPPPAVLRLRQFRVAGVQ